METDWIFVNQYFIFKVKDQELIKDCLLLNCMKSDFEKNQKLPPLRIMEKYVGHDEMIVSYYLCDSLPQLRGRGNTFNFEQFRAKILIEYYPLKRSNESDFLLALSQKMVSGLDPFSSLSFFSKKNTPIFPFKFNHNRLYTFVTDNKYDDNLRREFIELIQPEKRNHVSFDFKFQDETPIFGIQIIIFYETKSFQKNDKYYHLESLSFQNEKVVIKDMNRFHIKSTFKETFYFIPMTLGNIFDYDQYPNIFKEDILFFTNLQISAKINTEYPLFRIRFEIFEFTPSYLYS